MTVPLDPGLASARPHRTPVPSVVWATPAGHAVVLVDAAFAVQVVGIAVGRTPDTPAVGSVGHSALEAEGSRKPAGGERIAAVGEVVVHTPAVLLQCRKPAAGAAAG